MRTSANPGRKAYSPPPSDAWPTRCPIVRGSNPMASSARESGGDAMKCCWVVAAFVVRSTCYRGGVPGFIAEWKAVAASQCSRRYAAWFLLL